MRFLSLPTEGLKMRNANGLRVIVFASAFSSSVVRLLAALFLVITGAAMGAAQSPSLDELVSGVVRIKTFINPDGRTLQNLGREREGSGIVIDGAGLVLTIGYIMVEAHAAEVTSNDGRTV